MSDPQHSERELLRKAVDDTLREHAHSGSATVEMSGGYLYHSCCRCGWRSPNRFEFGQATHDWHDHQTDAVLAAIAPGPLRQQGGGPMTARHEATSIDILSGYECPECGPVIDPDDPMPLTEGQATTVLGGDENGTLRCLNDWCDEELEPMLDAALDMLAMVAERMPDLAPTIAADLAEAADIGRSAHHASRAI